MKPTTKPRVKICCIKNLEEAWMAIDHGADALGLVSAMPSGPGQISEERIAEIAAEIPPPIATFLLTSLQDVDAIVAQHRRCPTTTLQLVDRLETGTHRDLRAALPGVSIVGVIHVVDEESIDEARAMAADVNAILLDSGNQKLPVKELGGTGRTHDWSLSLRIREAVEVPIFLAGGLRPENVGEAIHRVRPFGIDLCSGVRTDDRLDGGKLQRFFAGVHEAVEPSNPDIQIHHASPAESARLTEIAHAAKRHWGYPERWIEIWKDELTLTPQFILEHPVYTVDRQGEAVACCALAAEGTKASIEHMWVDPDQIGSGIGRRLFAHVVDEARIAGIREIEIISDPYAAGFYEHMGAIKTGDHHSEIEGQERVLPIYTLTIS